MTKAERMDELIAGCDTKMSRFDLFRIVKQTFNIDLAAIPGLPNAIDTYLAHSEHNATGAELRQMLNRTFGIHLDALSSLEGSRISLFSKGQWMLRHEKDLFAVHTGAGDVDVKIAPTPYFTEQTGAGELPDELITALTGLGFHYDEQQGCYYFANPAGEAVQDAFKGHTIMAILNAVKRHYAHI